MLLGEGDSNGKINGSERSVDENNVIDGGECNFVPDRRGLGWAMFESMQKFKENIAHVRTVLYFTLNFKSEII